VTNSLVRTDGQPWTSLELSLERDADDRSLPKSSGPIKDLPILFDWLLETGLFEFAVLAKKDVGILGALTSTRWPSWPQVVLETSDARVALPALIAAGTRGFELIVGAKVNHAELFAFLTRFGYREAGISGLGSGESHDLTRVSSHRESFNRGIVLATRLEAKCLCVFAHDADPIYLLSPAGAQVSD
jgi:hypothetical protein